LHTVGRTGTAGISLAVAASSQGTP
jgi:hypothetical protein